jgi:hypothetical protein
MNLVARIVFAICTFFVVGLAAFNLVGGDENWFLAELIGWLAAIGFSSAAFALSGR